MNRRSVLVLIAAVMTAAPALAILGVGDIVFDPQNFEEALQQLAQLQQQYTQLVQTYAMIRSQYNQMLWMARTLPSNLANPRPSEAGSQRRPARPSMAIWHRLGSRKVERVT